MTQADIHEAIDTRLEGIIFEADSTTDRDTVIECLDDACDDAWSNLVQSCRLDAYTVDDFVSTAEPVAQILSFAKEHAWVEDDSGLWEGMPYGLPACVAYYSLRNCFYQAMSDRGYDINDDFPFAE